MKIIFLIPIIGILFIVYGYIFATISNMPSKIMSRLPRFIYLLGFPILFFGFGKVIAYGFVIDSTFWNLLISSAFTIPGIAIALERLRQIPNNIEYIGQNVWFSQSINGKSLRLRSGSGLIPLLHGEVLKSEVVDEVLPPFGLKISNIECKDGSPMIAEIIYNVRPDFDNFQKLAELSHDNNKRWSAVNENFGALITARVTDIFRKHSKDEILNSNDVLTEELNSEKDGNYFFQKEEDVGHKIIDMRFKDTDVTAKVRSADEQISVSASYVKAAEVLAGKKKLSGDEREKRLHDVQVNEGKREMKDININVSGIDEDKKSQFAAQAYEAEGG